MKKFLTFVGILFLMCGLAFADQYSEAATDGTFDLEWDYNTTAFVAGDTLIIADSTASAWGSHVLAFTDAGYTGLVHLKDVLLTDYTIQADVYIIGPADANAPLYCGLGIKTSHDEFKYYRFVYRNSSSSNNGQLKLQGYDGASWHISQSWTSGEDFDSLATGFHNFKIKVSGNQFWAYMDGKVLPGCPYTDDSPFLTEGYPGIYKYNTGSATVLFDNFLVTTPDLFFSEYIEGDGGNNKAMEIYNPTDQAIDLTGYVVMQNSNGGPWTEYEDSLSGTIEPGDVYVIANAGSEQIILDQADLTGSEICYFNGDDARALVKINAPGDTVVLDVIGTFPDDPGSGWDVAGIANATANHTLVRKESVFMGESDWAASAGTDADDSEWIVMDANTFNYLGLHPGMQPPDYVNVTIRANTSTNLDTLGVNHVVELRGALNTVAPGTFPDGKIINWGSDSDLDMVNTGGDYWEITFQMAPEDTLYYKMWTGYDASTGTSPGGGWEGPFEPSNGLTWDTRTFISGVMDTVLDVQYYHPDLAGAKTEQYWRPFEAKQDSVAIYFRVNMAGMTEGNFFDPSVNGPVGIRGGPPVGDNDWSEGAFVPLTREESSVIDGSFWSGTAYVPIDSITTGNTQLYKFYVQNDGGKSWEDTPNRELVFTASMVANGDTTLHWDWFSGLVYEGVEPVTSIITWRVSTEALESLDLFDRGVGDEIIVRGPRGWGKDEAIELFFNPLLQEWTSANEEFTMIPGYEMSYKYYIAWDSSRVDTTSPNYLENINLEDDGYEEPSIRGGSNRLHVYQNAAEQMVEGDFGFDRQFFNSIPANGVFEQDMAITWNIDMNNAADADSNKDNTLFVPGVDSVWVEWDGELMAIPQGMDNWGERFLLLTDTNGDMIYSGTLNVKDIGWYQLGYRITYKTADGTYVTNGGGNDRGRRYYQYIHPERILEGSPWPITEWAATYDLPVVNWRAEDLYVESPPPDLTTPTAIGDKIKMPHKFALEQNYPNPFNPVTTIKYELAKTSKVEISIYDIMGRKVKTLVNKKQEAGNHLTVWNGMNSNGYKVTSGIYFVKMKSSDFKKVRKMTLIK